MFASHPSMHCRSLAWLATAIFVLVAGSPVLPSTLADDAPPVASVDGNQPLATIDGVVIRRAAARRLLSEKLPNADPARVADGEPAALETLLRHRLALARLVARQEAASDADVDHEIHVFREQLKRVGQTFQAHLKDHDITEEEFRFDLRWRLSWTAFLLEKLTDENLKKYFEAHRADFDGTKVHAAHILLGCDVADAAALRKKIDEAAALRLQIDDKNLTFAAAAKQYSTAPTAAEGGDIGWIERRQPMPEAFSAAAFALKAGETSPPVTTPFGVHLIHCLAIEPGQNPWESQRSLLRAAVTRYLFDSLVEQQRGHSKIELPPAARR